MNASGLTVVMHVLVARDADAARRAGAQVLALREPDLRQVVQRLSGTWMAWLPAGSDFRPVDAALAALRQGASIAPWLPGGGCSWIARRDLLDPSGDWGPPDGWHLRPFLDSGVLHATASWAAVPVRAGPEPRPAGRTSPLTATSSVLVAIPHHRCERWLAACLRSVVEQTHPPSAIAVLHDGPDEPPRDIVARYPGVSLYRSPVRVGPYALVQALLDRTRFDAVMFQDADDWSSRVRLATLLAEAERTGAELVGGQEIRVDGTRRDVHAVRYPRDVNAAFDRGGARLLLHPTSLVATALLARLGGFATGLRFGGDGELLRRAAFAARIVNVPAGVYFRRARAGSLTTSRVTGLGSPARDALIAAVTVRAARNREVRAAGGRPDLRPLAVGGPVELVHVTGPVLT
jgi:hypothetical protein